MGKKKQTKRNRPLKIVPCNAFRCNICGKIVPSIHRSHHLIVAHKLNGTAIKSLFTDTGKVFKKSKNTHGSDMMQRYERNLRTPEPDMPCGSHPAEPKPIKIIYTPMGNKR